MLATVYAATALVLAGSLIAGSAMFVALGGRGRSWLAPAAGFALLMIAARLAIRLPGRATTAMAVLAALVVVSAGYLAIARRPLGRPTGGLLVPVGVIAVVVAAASVPFLANDRVGVFGAGRQSDLQAHIYAADYLTSPAGFRPDAIGNGYPLGPHALVAATARLTGGDTEAAFLGLILAIPVLTALTALAALGELAPGRRVVAASLVGLPYLGASFLAEGTFKELALGLFLLAFVLCLRTLGRERSGQLAMGASLIALTGAGVYTYSYPGLAWPMLALLVWGALELVGGWRPRLPGFVRRPSRRALLIGGAVLIILVAIAIPEARRISNFRQTFELVEETRGRLREPISPAQALGLWPSGNFRIDPRDTALATAMGLAALGALGLGLLFWIRRRDFAIPAGLVAAALVYAEARRRSGFYIEAKALAVMAPLPLLIALRALLTGRNGARLLVGTVICAGAAASSFMALRASPVAPDAHSDQLARLRPLVAGHPVLFLGLDRLSQHTLRGASVRQGNLLASHHSRPYKRWTPNRGLDFDTIPYKRLNRFDFVITTAAGFASGPPPNFRRVAATHDYLLFKRTGVTAPRATLNEQASIGGRFDCSQPRLEALSRRDGHAAVIEEPVIGAKTDWTASLLRGRRSPYFAAGAARTQQLQLRRGRWRLSLQYHSPVPLTLEVRHSPRTRPHARFSLPASVDGKVPHFEGGGPFWPAGELRVDSTRVLLSDPPQGEAVPVITVRAARLTKWQRFLGVKRRVALGKIAATGDDPARMVPLGQACGRFVDWYSAR